MDPLIILLLILLAPFILWAATRLIAEAVFYTRRKHNNPTERTHQHGQK